MYLLFICRKKLDDSNLTKRKFAGVLMTDQKTKTTELKENNEPSSIIITPATLQSAITTNTNTLSIVAPIIQPLVTNSPTITIPITTTAEIETTTPIVQQLQSSPLDGKSDLIKERKRRIRIDDDDESPTFNPMARGIRRIRGRGSRGNRGGRGAMRLQLNQQKIQRTGGIFLLNTPEKSHDATIFTTPEGKVCVKFYISFLHPWHPICLIYFITSHT